MTQTPGEVEVSLLAEQIGEAIFSALRQMDAEAETVRDGHATGLWWYGAHARPESKRSRTEVEWSKRMASLLNERGVTAKCEHRYPSSRAGNRQHVDVLITLPAEFGGGRLWLEVKGAWKQYWLERGSERIYRSYLFHPLVAGLDATKTHTAALDIEKLKGISPTHGSHVGFLLIGFDGEEPMEGDVREFARLAGIDAQPWQCVLDAWEDVRRPGQHVRCWLWVRAV